MYEDSYRARTESIDKLIESMRASNESLKMAGLRGGIVEGGDRSGEHRRSRLVGSP